MNSTKNAVLKVLIASAIILLLLFMIDKYAPILIPLIVVPYLIWIFTY